MPDTSELGELGEFGDEAGIRPQAVEALLRALQEEDSARIAELEAAGISPDGGRGHIRPGFLDKPLS